jgi:flagellar biosynthesis protein
MPTPERERIAAALQRSGEDVPRVVAVGRGQLAEAIVAAAAEAGVPLREDPLLAQALEALDLNKHVPPELYRAVAEALIWAYRLGSSRVSAEPAGLAGTD